VRRDKIEPEHDADFSVIVGDSVPERVRFHLLPDDLASIVPQYRGFDYVRSGDRIVIVDPRSRRIVYVVDVNDGREEAYSGSRIELSPEQKRIIHAEIVDHYRGDRNSGFEIRLGQRVPEAIRLEPVPEDVYSDIPVIEPYRYFVVGEEVVIVEPGTREIVDVID
jgi:hypothetical protein